MPSELTARVRDRAKKAKAKRVKARRKHLLRESLQRRRSSDDLSVLKMAMVP